VKKIITANIAKLRIAVKVKSQLLKNCTLINATAVISVVNITFLNLTVSFLPRIVHTKNDNKNSSGIDMVKKFNNENCSIYYNSFPQKI
jgi:hypothetical protein